MKANNTDIGEENQYELAADALKDAAKRALAAGVLKQAAQDLRRFCGATSKVEQGLYLDAYRWFTVGESASPFSFLNVCQLLNLAPDDVRQELIGDCGRAARQFQISVGQLFLTERNTSAAYSYENVN